MKTKIIISVLGLLLSLQILAQKTLTDRNGVAHFFSDAPLEDIEATNEKVIGAIDLENGSVAVSMYMKDFHFDKSLMEEHFNENYIESEKFPKATFTGKIKDFSKLDLTKDGQVTAVADGALSLHGVQKRMQMDVHFVILKSDIEAVTTFKLKVADFEIDIPKMLFQNIAEVVEIDSKFKFQRTP